MFEAGLDQLDATVQDQLDGVEGTVGVEGELAAVLSAPRFDSRHQRPEGEEPLRVGFPKVGCGEQTPLVGNS